MTAQAPGGQTARESRRRRKIVLVVLLLLVVVLLLVVGDMAREGGVVATSDSGTEGDSAAVGMVDTAILDSASVDSGTVVANDSGGTSSTKHSADGNGEAPVAPGDTGSGSTRGETVQTRADSAHRAGVDTLAGAPPDSAAVLADTTADPCAVDTTAPSVYPDPSGGLHRRTVQLAFVSDEQCDIEWRFADEDSWREYDGDWVVVKQTATLEYRATDECGNKMVATTERYEIKRAKPSARCLEGMELVVIGGAAFCVDRYEWPNKHDHRPSAFVSQFQAADSCFKVDKRLCTAEEWKLACSGPYGWAYPYGDTFERRACVTKDTVVARSGSKPECRGYFEVFDMSGNLLEWTSTRSKANRGFFDVMGGFWESGQQSGCFHERYSYFPQNRHNPVGFRCCSDAEPVAE